MQGGAAVGLSVSLQARHPGLDVVHADLADAHVTDRALDDLIGQLEISQNGFRVR
jgi:hypothetical protein